jgi:hypothetical protein
MSDSSPTQTPVPDLEFGMQFTSSRKGAQLARRVAVRRLAEWGYGTDAPAVIIGELVANAVTHGWVAGRDFHLRLAVCDVMLRIEVADACGEVQPERQKPSDEAECGRGLMLIAGLAAKWGVADRIVGKTVWAEVPLECGGEPNPLGLWD